MWPRVLALTVLLTACGQEDRPPEGQGTPPTAVSTAETPSPDPGTDDLGTEEPGSEEPGTGGAPAVPTSGEEGAVAQVVVAYFNALASRDFVTACLQLGPEARKDVATVTQVRGDCEDAMEVAFEGFSDDELASLRDVPVSAVQISGDRATVSIEGAERPVPLERKGGAWLISEFAGGGG